MSKDPAFLFYPGDYLRDTQTLNEKSQVAYDRIMCEHMRNICITQSQLNFFTKRLDEDEVEAIMFVLTKIKGGYQITWVAESITKRRAYSDSRRKNRKGKINKDMLHTSETYDTHMENENVNENKDKKFNFRKSFLDLEVEPNILDDWLMVRKTKKATNSETAFNAIFAQVEKSGLTANECIKKAAENSWSGFGANWGKEKTSLDEDMKHVPTDFKME